MRLGSVVLIGVLAIVRPSGLLADADPPRPTQDDPTRTKTSGATTKSGARKVYISVDLEGISGVNGEDQINPGQSEYARARKLMAEDTNAAIRGAFEGGATAVIVNDSHGGMRNLLPEDLDPRARLISHSFKLYGMMEGLDDSFSAVVFVGYHAKADSPAGLFAHTGSGVIRDLQVNGRSVGEGGMNAALAAWYGVPVVVVSGDDVAVAEVKSAAPGVRTVAVKRAINIRAVELRPLAEARQELQQAVRDGVAAAKPTAAHPAKSYRVQVRFRSVTHPQVVTAFREIELVAPDTVAFTRATMPEAYRLIRVLYRFINPD
jgi:D-amino peptidase